MYNSSQRELLNSQKEVNDMTKGDFIMAQNVNGEGGAILQVFRLLTSEEQRIACAVLNGMQLQKQLDAQRATGRTDESQQT